MSAMYSKLKTVILRRTHGKNGSVSVHQRNIQSLAIELLQIKHGQSRKIVTDIFTQTAGRKGVQLQMKSIF